MMEYNNKPISFLLFISAQIVISTIVIIVFQQTFFLSFKTVVGHLFVIGCIQLLIMGLGVTFISIRQVHFQKIVKYIISSLYAFYLVLLYYVYLAAFLGKSFNSRVFTFQVILGYLKYLNELIKSFSVNPFLVYFAFFGIPLIIVAVILFQSNFICQAFVNLKNFILRHNFNNPPKYIRVNIIVFLLSVGFVSGVLLLLQLSHYSISVRLFHREEPLVSVFLKNGDPFQGQAVFSENEDLISRKEYPGNINFQKKNVVVIVIDALRSDHLSLFGYKRKTSPFLDSLYSAGNLKRVDLSFSVSGASFPGINGILRSRIWSHMGYNNFSLQQLLKDQGYSINFLLSGDHTNFYGLKSFYGKPSDIDYYLDGSEDKKYTINDDRLVLEGLDNIANYKDKPSFFHLHLNSVHIDGIRLDKFRKFLPADATQFNVENYTNRYDNGILQADDCVKQIFQTLATKGYLQNSIVVITADHGEALGERGEFGHVKNVHTDQILIPLLIYETEKVQYKNTEYATSVDIAPTIVDRLGLPIPESWEGNSLISKGMREFTYHQMYEHYAIIHTTDKFRLKYIYNTKSKEEELFDLNTDLYETKNIIASWDRRYVEAMRNRLTYFRITDSARSLF
jgi:glucan phosphoethanolaminetransferase (alkaline phosphatase superfamily)